MKRLRSHFYVAHPVSSQLGALTKRRYTLGNAMNAFSVLNLFLFQAQDATQPAQPVTPLGGSALLDLAHNLGPIAIGVLVILLIASLQSWSIILGKWASFRRAGTQSKRFLRAFRKAERMQDVAAVSEQFKPSPLVQVFEDTYAEYKHQSDGTGTIRNLKALERAAQTAASEGLSAMETRMTWLATIGNIATFIGLFGTIMGIVDAFHGLGSTGGATLRAVAPGISEALITTAAGIFVAIPAVVGYNQLTARLREVAARLDDFTRELLNAMEEVQYVLAPPEEYNRQREAPRGLHR
ncbi:MAG: MotA/TolQ/ExbB proton channel family protein [Acidobacteriaceae bacterium]